MSDDQPMRTWTPAGRASRYDPEPPRPVVYVVAWRSGADEPVYAARANRGEALRLARVWRAAATGMPDSTVAVVRVDLSTMTVIPVDSADDPPPAGS